METQNKILYLRQTLNNLNYHYYVLNSPLIDDKQYDDLMSELEKLEALHPEFSDSNSPTQRVGSDIQQSFSQVKHKYQMFSLSNTYNSDELREFNARIIKEYAPSQIEYVCELKFDGTAISLTYINGNLERAVTRGDGAYGDDVTANIRTIKSIPLTLQNGTYPSEFEVRGEVFMPHSSFDRLNQEREEIGYAPFANPRNAAAGTLKLQNSREVAIRNLDCILYSLHTDNIQFTTHYECLMAMKEWGFKTSEHTKLYKTIDEVIEHINLWEERRKNLPYDTDGMVIKLNNISMQRSLGFTAKAPRWAVAYKFKTETALTELLSIDFQVGRTGAITPVANLAPVKLAGTIVKRASLHNADQISLLDIRISDSVYVEKGGEIIPKITGVDLSRRTLLAEPIEYITHCPACGSTLIKEKDEAKHYCRNSQHCPPQIIGRIVHFISRAAMNIDSLGEETIELLFNNKLISNVADLYTLKEEQLIPLERMGKKSAENAIYSIKNSKSTPFSRLLYAIGIRYVGQTTAKKIAAHFKSMDAVINASLEELLEVEEVGQRIAQSIIDFFQDSENIEIVERLRSHSLQFYAEAKKELSSSLNEMSIIISGTFSSFSRDELKELIEQHGGKNVSSISSKTSFMVAGDKIGPSKLQKAEKLGVKIIDEYQLLEMINKQ